MHTFSFCVLVVPLLTTCALASAIGPLLWFNLSYGSFRAYIRGALLCQFVLLLFRLLMAVLKSVMCLRTFRGKLPEQPSNGILDKFVLPMAEGVVKLVTLAVCLCFIAQPQNRLSYVFLVSFVYASNKVLGMLVLFSPVHYEQNYAQFISSLEKFEDGFGSARRDTMKVVDGISVHNLRNKPPDEPSHIFETPYRSDSIDSHSNTRSTIISPCSDANSTPVFNLDSFQSASTNQITIPGEPNLNAAHLDTIERLYCVSPKDTFYLQHEYYPDFDQDAGTVEDDGADAAADAHRHSILNIGEDIDDANSHNRDETCDETDVSSVHSIGTHFGGGGGGNYQHTFPDGSKIEFGGGAGFDYSHSRPSTDSTRCATNKPFSAYLLCLAWLLPLSANTKEGGVPSRKTEGATLRKKLSTYTLDSERSFRRKFSIHSLNSEIAQMNTSRSLRSYGSIDLESQSSFDYKGVCNSHTYYKFAQFANKYLDIWSPDFGGILSFVDPAYMRFGTPILRLSTKLFIMHGFSHCLWQYSSLLWVALPLVYPNHLLVSVTLIVPVVIVVKLYCVNYLYGQCTRSYKFSVGLEFIINICMYVSALFYYYLLASNK